MAAIKTALSINGSRFEQAEALAKELDVSRSRVYAMAREEFIARREAGKILALVNSIYPDATPAGDEERVLKY